MTDIIEDVSNLTTIPKESLNKLIDKAVWVISSAVNETNLDNKTLVEMDVGLGKLYIDFSDDKIRYKFVPSNDLEDIVTQTVIGKKNMLKYVLDKRLKDKILSTYKDII